MDPLLGILVVFACVVALFVMGVVALVGRWTKSRAVKVIAGLGALFVVYLLLASWFDSCTKGMTFQVH